MSVPGSSSEHVLGSIQVTANIRAGSEVLKLFFTETRIIVAHVGKRGMGSLPATSIIGKWGAGFEGLLRSPSESRKKRKMEQGARDMSAADVLRADKNNFFVDYGEVVRVELISTPYSVGIMMLTRDDKFEFSTRESSEKVLKSFRDALSTRVEVRRHEPGHRVASRNSR